MNATLKSYRYLRSGLHGDLALGVAGLVAGSIFTLAAKETGFIFILFVSITLLALFFTLNTLRRYWIEIKVDEQSVSSFNRGKQQSTLQWSEIAQMKLRFFGSKSQREKGKGTLSLTLIGRNKKKVSFESGLTDFEGLATVCFDQTREFQVEIDPVSLENFGAVGVKFQ